MASSNQPRVGKQHFKKIATDPRHLLDYYHTAGPHRRPSKRRNEGTGTVASCPTVATMSSIKKLSIQGIRSFSPNQEETIEFYSPLTMIVGANGCGKTSIIEALKYACTGALPPTCRNGQSFINDPTMTDATEVKACVKLRFTNKANKNTVCIRSMQLSKKKTKLEFK